MRFVIAVDFDGTIVDHQFPEIGKDVPGAFQWMKKFQDEGASLILWTVRGPGIEEGGPSGAAPADYLELAVEYCRARGIEFWAINENPEQKAWSQSPKAYANLFIDDAAVGCPLVENPRMDGRPYADWNEIGPFVMDRLRGNKALQW